MKLHAKALALAAAAATLSACVQTDDSLGKDLVDISLLYDTYTFEFPLEEIQMKKSSDLSGFSDTRITIGAIRDEVFGLTTRESAFTLIPALDTIDLGTNPVPVKFNIHFEADTVSCARDADAWIMQNIYVHELADTLSLKETGTTKDIPYLQERICKGVPVYNGTDSLSFEFTDEFARKYIQAIVDVGGTDHILSSYSDFIKAIPGIYIRTDAPEGNGGRINLFNLSCLSVVSNYYTRNANVGLLTVNSTWDGVQKDSTFLIIPGEPAFYDEVTYLNNNTKFYQYAFNRTTHETEEGKPGERLYVEGGGGLKPVISARELQVKIREKIASIGGNPEKAKINKATIVLPYEMPEDYRDMKYFPSVLSPTIRTETDTTVTFGGLTDASVSTENQGDIDRSNLVYSPDITYHLQEIIDRDDLDTSTNADIWLLTIHSEQVANANGSLYDNDYYRSLLYASYYSSLYGGGYGGYGYGGYGYGSYGYGSSYSNYYTYMMMAQMMAASSQQTYSTTTELDKDRYYQAILNGPDAQRAPFFRVTFSLPKE